MVDTVSRETRSRIMAGIKGVDTKPELLLRKGLHSRGLRFRLHDKRLPGKPDMVFPKYRAVILTNGCFWHKHDCHLFKWPSTHQEFWRDKIVRNCERDELNYRLLAESGWRIAKIWECALKGKLRWSDEDVIDLCESWLKGTELRLEVIGK